MYLKRYRGAFVYIIYSTSENFSNLNETKRQLFWMLRANEGFNVCVAG